jgi:hypothetical protein
LGRKNFRKIIDLKIKIHYIVGAKAQRRRVQKKKRRSLKEQVKPLDVPSGLKIICLKLQCTKQEERCYKTLFSRC